MHYNVGAYNCGPVANANNRNLSTAIALLSIILWGCGPSAQNDQSAAFEKINERQDRMQTAIEGQGHTLTRIGKTVEETYNITVQTSEQTQNSGEVEAKTIRDMQQRVDNSTNKWWNMVILAASSFAVNILLLAMIYFMIREFLRYKFGVKRAIQATDNNLDENTWAKHLNKK